MSDYSLIAPPHGVLELFPIRYRIGERATLHGGAQPMYGSVGQLIISPQKNSNLLKKDLHMELTCVTN